MKFNSTGLIGPQPAHAERLFTSLVTNGFALDISCTGSGKTYCAAAISRELNLPVVLIAPKTVLGTWTRIFNSFGVNPKVIVNYELLARGNTPYMKFKRQRNPTNLPGNDNRELLPDFRLPKNSLVILDEGHRCKGNDTINSQMLINLVQKQYKVLFISATSVCSVLDMRGLGFLLQLHSLFDFKEYCLANGAQWLGQWGALTLNPDDLAAKRGMMALHDYIFNVKKCASRMSREDFGDLFPESQIVADTFDLGSNSPKIQKVYSDMEYELGKLESSCENYRDHIFAILMAARRQAELLKVPLFCEKIEDLYDEGKSIVLFVNFQDTIDAVFIRLNKLNKFKDKICFVIGNQTADDRVSAISDFQNDSKRICLSNIAAGGVAISLHDVTGKHARASIISPTWSAQACSQAIGRIWRQGGLSKSYQIICYAAKCIEEQICSRVRMKLGNLETLHDGDLCESPEWILG